MIDSWTTKTVKGRKMKLTAAQKRIEVGSGVKYSRGWLRSTGNFTGYMPFIRGTVTEITGQEHGYPIASITWQACSGHHGGQWSVAVCNLVPATHKEVE